MIGGWEILLILGALLLLFGGRRLPELARNLGKGMREFKKASKGLSDDIDVTGEIQDVKPAKDE